jgi:hypothetical protein
MSKGARNRRQRAQALVQQQSALAAAGLSDLRPQPGPFGAAPPWKQPSTLNEALERKKQFMQTMPQLIVCGHVGAEPLTVTRRRELLSAVGLSTRSKPYLASKDSGTWRSPPTSAPTLSRLIS